MNKQEKNRYKIPLSEAQKIVSDSSSYRPSGEMRRSKQVQLDKLIVQAVRIASGYADPETQSIKYLEF